MKGSMPAAAAIGIGYVLGRQVNLLDIELLTIKLRLVIASLDTAREVGINWWEADPWLSAESAKRLNHGDRDGDRELRKEIRRLCDRVSELESGQ